MKQWFVLLYSLKIWCYKEVLLYYFDLQPNLPTNLLTKGDASQISRNLMPKWRRYAETRKTRRDISWSFSKVFRSSNYNYFVRKSSEQFDLFVLLMVLRHAASDVCWHHWSQFKYPLTHCDQRCHMATEILVNIGSANGLLPVGTKPLAEPKLTYHKQGSVASTNFTSTTQDINPFNRFRYYTFKLLSHLPGASVLTLYRLNHVENNIKMFICFHNIISNINDFLFIQCYCISFNSSFITFQEPLLLTKIS